MSNFIKHGNEWTISPKGAMDLRPALPGGTYIVKFHPERGYWLSEVEGFTLPRKLYGTTDRDADRVLRTFKDRTMSTGLLLAGEKGSGKTLLAKVISARANEQGMPTIIINSPMAGDNFNRFIQDINQPAIILFDEFEKIYRDKDAQNAVLTLFDGVFPTKKLFITTVNNKYEVSTFLHNRPGRMFYELEFKGLTPEFVREYCEDVLEDREHIDGVVDISEMYEPFNFDMLQALVEELNRYHETPEQALRFLNISQIYATAASWDMKLWVDGKPAKRLARHMWVGNPLELRGNSVIATYEGKDEDGDKRWIQVEFEISDMVGRDLRSKTFTFQKRKGDEHDDEGAKGHDYKVVLTKRQGKTYHPSSATSDA